LNTQETLRTHVIITADQKSVISSLAKATAKTFSASLRDVLEAGIPAALDNQHAQIVKRLEQSKQALEIQRKQVASQEQLA
jgi:hypothetical protein